jgi:hypothetical protein
MKFRRCILHLTDREPLVLGRSQLYLDVLTGRLNRVDE